MSKNDFDQKQNCKNSTSNSTKRIINRKFTACIHLYMANIFIAYNASLHQGVQRYSKQSFAPALCNRLDKNTQGLVIAAKNAEALRLMNEKIKYDRLTKTYLCLVHGVPEKKSAENRHPSREAYGEVFLQQIPRELKRICTFIRMPPELPLLENT